MSLEVCGCGRYIDLDFNSEAITYVNDVAYCSHCYTPEN